MKTNTTEPSAIIEETAKLTQLANFIQYRKQQKSQLTNTKINKNSLSKENQNNNKIVVKLINTWSTECLQALFN